MTSDECPALIESDHPRAASILPQYMPDTNYREPAVGVSSATLPWIQILSVSDSGVHKGQDCKHPNHRVKSRLDSVEAGEGGLLRAGRILSRKMTRGCATTALRASSEHFAPPTLTWRGLAKFNLIGAKVGRGRAEVLLAQVG
jgi:hypothetical protein